MVRTDRHPELVSGSLRMTRDGKISNDAESRGWNGLDCKDLNPHHLDRYTNKKSSLSEAFLNLVGDTGLEPVTH